MSQIYNIEIRSELLNKTVNNDLRIINDCLKIINTSSNINTVIKRFDDLIVSLTRLSSYEDNPNIFFEKELPSHAIMRMHYEKPQIINQAIQRSYNEVLFKCSTLKDETSRLSRKQKFFDELQSLIDLFPSETRNFVDRLINKEINTSLSELKKILDTDSNVIFPVDNYVGQL